MALFKRKLLAKVLDGSKVQTRRTHRRMWTVGKVYGIRDRLFAKPEARILILRRFGQRLGEISKEEARKEGFETLDEFKAAWKEIYGQWQPDQVVVAYEFKLLKADTPRLI
ncbi:ASCH domain-containing protein [Candidatus Bathyarchaeota archaeon]|nr:ASCH domain-containing protein [Candidatus Bathyarchaeota archaeon]